METIKSINVEGSTIKEVEDLKEILEEIKNLTRAVRMSAINERGLDVEERLMLLAYFMGCITGTVDRALNKNQDDGIPSFVDLTIDGKVIARCIKNNERGE